MNAVRSVGVALMALMAMPAFPQGFGRGEVVVEGPQTNQVVVTPPRGHHPPPPDRGWFEADIWTDEDEYVIGDSIRVSFRVDEDAYVYVFNTDARGVRTQIFPNYYDPDNYCRAGVTYTIPTRNYDLAISGPEGRESLDLYATTEAGRHVEVFQTYSQQEPFAVLSHEGEAALNAIVVTPPPTTERVVIVPSQPAWARAITYIDVYEPRRPQPLPTGSLVVRVSPNHVGVYVDGNFAGYAPSTIHGISPGYHDIELTRPGWATYRDEIYIQPGSPTYLQVDLRRSRRGY